MKNDTSVSFQKSTILPWVELRIADKSSSCYDLHSHDEFSFGIIDQGQAGYHNRHYRHRIGVGDIVTINPADTHSCNPESEVWSYRMLFIDTFKMGKMQQEVMQNETCDYLPFKRNVEQTPEIKQSVISLIQSLQTEESLLQVQSFLFDFIEKSVGNSWEDKPGKTNVYPGLNRVREKLLDELQNTHQLNELADEAGMSRYQLLRAFKRQFGLSPHAYLMDEKIKRAKKLLKSGQTISDTALQLGFSDQAHFQRQFKRKLAVTPKFYQSHFIY
ncbi:AraC family transcriptional regulator [Vibrio salinus]|uniref:AraC family transcriptional regulator n=1 Tax=Vibrio salinus TaxID=2899784 RepID=UPI001E459936|nr:AraC family transcriptional regulator [Vibrio salinus]MCE0494173.1 AraC family transcriptional regulator [Vibrio salinus]